MKVIFYGDSITVGTYSGAPEGSSGVADPNFAMLLQAHFGWSYVINHAINGVSYSGTSPIRGDISISNRSIECPECDICFLTAGTNDYGTSVTLGEDDDGADVSFCGGVNQILQVIRSRAKNVVVVTPIPRGCEGKNKAGYTLQEYRDALARLAEKWGAFCIRGEAFLLDPNDEQQKLRYIRDGVHLQPEGHKLYAEYLIQEIEKLRLNT